MEQAQVIKSVIEKLDNLGLCYKEISDIGVDLGIDRNTMQTLIKEYHNERLERAVKLIGSYSDSDIDNETNRDYNDKGKEK